jgi:hypothetical protein
MGVVVEVMLRVQMPDRPGELAKVAGAVGAVGGDIQAVDVVEAGGIDALDDLYVVVPEGGLRPLIEQIEALPDVTLVHATASRGHLGDDVGRVALVLQSLLDGAMVPEHAVSSLVSGLLHASASVLPEGSPLPAATPSLLVVPFAREWVVVRREYRFTQTEQERLTAVLRACEVATRNRAADLSS